MSIRHTTTKNDIKEALTLLLAEKSLEEISISQLTKKAGINRSTFYLHYIDKYDLLDQLKEETLETIHHLLAESLGHPTNALLDVLTYLYQNIQFYKEISRHSQFCLRENIADFLEEVTHRTPGAVQVVISSYGVPEKYALQLFIEGVVGVITNWINEGGQESPEELATILLASPGFQW
ncbi:Transcriptional regulator, TetR family [Streptococcus sp. DD10]|uniref:TetR/AcrR family transcriptional regulator C-terminal domain-containing protein n=1 Tax=Streptococcus sp. DD10 TaxID=1777878 RepID=UPI000792F7F7|nr:TetR/AcrR family transcriptional regulator C-terminal domain-containing protein [Streptococcus sp. DD10]KXT73851.1 Transcriptional regulator, TetR family [Streptococcus sp. DD10]